MIQSAESRLLFWTYGNGSVVCDVLHPVGTGQAREYALVRGNETKVIDGEFFQKSYWDATPIPDAAIASKVGLLLKCVEWGTEVDENGKRKCKRSISTHAHEPALIENGRLRYVVALMTVGIDHGVREVLQRLIGPLNDLIRSQNP